MFKNGKRQNIEYQMSISHKIVYDQKTSFYE